MAVDFGVNPLASLDRKLAAAARRIDPTIRQTVEKELTPLPDEVAASALRILPKRGGLAKRTADRVIPKQQRKPGSVEVFVVGKSGLKELVRLDRGSVRHPVHANPNKTRDEWRWVNQPVNKGFWTRPTQLRADEIKVAVEAALDKLADGI